MILTTPLYTQNQVVVTLSVHLLQRPLRNCPIFEADERKALSSTRLAIASDIDTSNTAEHTKELDSLSASHSYPQHHVNNAPRANRSRPYPPRYS